jgi:hypothetical protein
VSVLPLVAVALYVAPSPTEKITKIAVMDVAVHTGVSPEIGTALSEAVVAEVRKRRGRSQVISAEELRSMMQAVAEHQKLGCKSDKDVACIAEIGGALGADQMLSGSLSKLGKTFVFGIKLIDVPHAKVLRSASVNLKTREDDDLLAAAASLVAQVFPEVEAAPPPVIQATPTPPPVPEAAISQPTVVVVSRHSRVPAVVFGVAGLAAGGVAVFGLTRVLAYNNDVSAINANQGSLNYQSVQNDQSSANLWQKLSIGLAVVGVAGLTTAVITW